MHRTFRLPVFTIVVAFTITACGGKEAPPADTATAAAAEPAVPAVTLASMAGDWDWVMKAEANDSILGKGMSHISADGSGYSVNAANPKDTTAFTSTIVGDSVIHMSKPYTDPAMPKNAGQMTFRYAGIASNGPTGTGIVAVSPVAKPDTVVVRARVEATKRP